MGIYGEFYNLNVARRSILVVLLVCVRTCREHVLYEHWERIVNLLGQDNVADRDISGITKPARKGM